MKSILAGIVLVFGLLQKSTAQSTVTVRVTNFVNDKGVCRACVFTNASSFDGESGLPLRCVQVSVKDKNATFSFNDLPAGAYAIFVFHDRNANNKLDKNFLGIPKEGYGASQNKLPFAAAPDFHDNKFLLGQKDARHFLIRLRNI